MVKENQELTNLLGSALKNAEQILVTKVSQLPYTSFMVDQDFFKAWARSYWGINLGEKRTNLTYPPGKPMSSTSYWSVISIEDEEQMIMFKLKYG